MNNPKKWFESWFDSDYYHVLYKHRDDSEANEFISALAQKLNMPPQSRCIDIACGKGRHSVALNKLGFDVVGIDLSKNSIEYAKQFENEQLQFFVHDIRSIFCQNCFDVALNLFTSFGYFSNTHQHEKAFKNMCLMVKPNGFFVFDFINSETNKTAQPKAINQLQIDDYSYIITKWQTETHYFKTIDVYNANQTQLLTKHTEQVQKFSLQQLKKMLQENNMNLIEVYGNYNLDSFSNDSPRIILVAQKQHA